ncbi:Uncharacterised protein [Serratia plymuthica]|nr:Uncharacterised protein [Serratia plymuthica]
MVDKEHEKKSSITEYVYYPDHAPRKESSTFRQTKSKGHKEGLPCSISGMKTGVEYHHLFCEWAFTDAVDWGVVKGVATGVITELPVLDMQSDLPLPAGETYKVEYSLLWAICKLAEFRGFDWNKFNLLMPETFIDSMANMLVIHEKFHLKPHFLISTCKIISARRCSPVPSGNCRIMELEHA